MQKGTTLSITVAIWLDSDSVLPEGEQIWMVFVIFVRDAF